MRRRRLPAEQVMWLVIGMALLRDRPITKVVSMLDLALPSPSKPTVAPSAIVQARDRLGESPMAWLFSRCADTWAHQSAGRERWRGLALYGMNGTTLRIPDWHQRAAALALCRPHHRTHHASQSAPLVVLVGVDDGRAYRIGGALIEHGNGYDGANMNDWEGLRAMASAQSRSEAPPRPVIVSPGSRLVEAVINPIKKGYPFRHA